MGFRRVFLTVASVAAVAATGLVVLTATPSYAATIREPFALAEPVCDTGDICADMYSGDIVEGEIDWFNRTASIAGDAFNNGDNHNCLGFIFTAYAGTTKVDTVVEEWFCHGGWASYGPAGIGDTNRVGGIDRIKVTICVAQDSIGSNPVCTWVHNYSKPAA